MYTPEQLHMFKVSAMVQCWEHLLTRARQAATLGRSWRGFKVGCALLACRLRPPDEVLINPFEFKIFTGANSKPVEGGYNVCAERIAISQALEAGYTHIPLMAVAGPVQSQSGVEGLTLYPCENCSAFIVATTELKGVLILTIRHTDNDPVDDDVINRIFEGFGIPEMMARHACPHHS